MSLFRRPPETHTDIPFADYLEPLGAQVLLPLSDDNCGIVSSLIMGTVANLESDETEAWQEANNFPTFGLTPQTARTGLHEATTEAIQISLASMGVVGAEYAINVLLFARWQETIEQGDQKLRGRHYVPAAITPTNVIDMCVRFRPIDS